MDPFAACQQLIRDIPSRSGVTALGSVTGVVNKSSTTRPPVLALAFVHAAARQLPAVANQFQRDKVLAKLVAEVCDVSLSLLLLFFGAQCPSIDAHVSM
jgi:hypothetical protein